MRMLEELRRVRIAAPADVSVAAAALTAAVERRLGDWRVAACASIAGRGQMRDPDGGLLATGVFGWTDRDEDRWWRAPRLALASPLAEACRYESDPFWCNALGFRPLLPNPLLDRIALADFAERALASAAIVVPVHMPFGVIGAASIVPRDPRLLDLAAPFAAHGEELGVLLRAFVTSYNHTMRGARRLPVGGGLSKREVECLRWAAVGKTDLEIGVIISRSRATIRFHIHNAAAKLDAVNRSQAVFKATQLGYLSLNN